MENVSEDTLEIKLTYLVLPKGAHKLSFICQNFKPELKFSLHSQIGNHFLYNPYKWLICKLVHLIYPIIKKRLKQCFKKKSSTTKFLLLIFKSS